MNEKEFARVAYLSGDTNIIIGRTPVTLCAHSIGMVVRQRKTQAALIVIPWMNIRNLDFVEVEKSYTGRFMADVVAAVFSTQPNKIEYGLAVNYWDEPAQREQRPIFAIGPNPLRFKTLHTTILQNRDWFMRRLDEDSRLQRRS